MTWSPAPRRAVATALAATATAAAALATAHAQGPGSDTLGRSTVQQTIRGDARTPGGFSGLRAGAGEPYVVRSELAPPGAARETRRGSLLYFAQLTDFQLSDEESPARVEFLDSSADDPLNTPFGAAWRPQEAFVADITEEAIRQVNSFAPASPVAQGGGARAPMGFAITTGDSADNQQKNEVEAVVKLLDGGTVTTNSGTSDPAAYATPTCATVPVETTPRYTGVQDYDDGLAGGAFYDPDEPVGQFGKFPRWPGIMDRAQQPFQATGLAVPSYVTFGNHDGLVQGNQAANPGFDDIARGCIKPFAPTPSAGAADTAAEAAALLSSGGAGLVAPDPGRTFVSKPGYKALHAQGKDGHGFRFIDPEELRASRGAAGYYSWSPAPGFRFIALETVSEGGVAGPSANGNVDDPQFRWIRRELEAARSAGQMVILFGHHPPRSLNSAIPDEAAGSCSGTDPQGGDARPGCDLDPRDSRPLHNGTDMEALLKEFTNVIALVSGHTHENKVTPVKRPAAGGFWEIETAAEIDFPNQNRLIEVMDNRDGTLSLFGTVLDHAGPIAAPPPGTPGASMSTADLAAAGRLLAYNDPQAAQASDTGEIGGGGLGRVQDRNVELLLPDPRPHTAAAPAAVPCSPTRGLRSALVRPRGRGARLVFSRTVRRPVTVDVFQHTAGREVLGERLVARFANRSSSVVWNGRANRRGRRVRDGLFSVRYTMRLPGGRRDVRRIALRRQDGRFTVRRAFARRDRCVLLRSFKLERPGFGGRTNRAVGVSYRLGEPARVTVRVLQGTRTVKIFGARDVAAGVPVRLRFDAEGRPRGDFRFVVELRTEQGTTKATLVARRV
jgi:metallophosphoesterase (TIGR03767 family)